MSALRRRLKQGAVALGSVGLLAGGFVGFLHTSPGHEWLRGKVEGKLDERVHENGSARVGGLTFSLLSGVRLQKITLRDAAGVEVATIDEAAAAPALRDLIKGKVSIDEVELRGARLRLVQLEGGGTNLAKLFEKKPDPLAPPPRPKKPLAYVRVGRFLLSGADVELRRVDGSLLSIKEANAEARVVASPASSDVDADVSKLSATVQLRRPDGQEITLRDLSTGLSARLTGGAGEVKLSPLSGALGLVSADGRRVEPTKVGIGGLSVGLSREQISAALQQLELLALTVGSGDARLDMAEGKPSGSGRGGVGGVRLDRDRINALLGKELLASHVDLEARVDGSREVPSLNLKLTTDGGALDAALKLDASGAHKPKFSLELSSPSLAVHRVVRLQDGAEVSLGALKVTARGEATSRADAAADVSLQLAGLNARGTAVDRVDAEARYEQGILKIHSLKIEALGQRLEGRGTYTPESKAISARVEAKTDLPALGLHLEKMGRKPPPAGVLRGVRLPEGLVVEVEGATDRELKVSVPEARVAVAGGAAHVGAKARLRKGDPARGEKAFVLEEGGSSIKLRGLSIAGLLSTLGRPNPGVTGRIDGDIDLTGPHAAASYDLKVQVERNGERVRAHARGKASAGSVQLKLDADRLAEGGEDRLLHAEVKAPLHAVGGRPRVDLSGPISIKLDVPARKLASLGGLLPPERAKKLPPEAAVEAHLTLEGSGRAPKGKLIVDASARPPGPLGPLRARAEVDIAPGAAGSVEATTSLKGWLREQGDAQLEARATVKLPGSPLVSRPDNAAWALEASLAPTPLSTLISIAAPLSPRPALQGDLSLSVALQGDRSDVRGKIGARVQGAGSGKVAPVDADVSLDLLDEATALVVKLTGNKQELASLSGKVAVGGRGLIPRIKERQPPPLDTAIEASLRLPERALASLAPWAPSLAGKPGQLGGQIDLKGTPIKPDLRGKIAVSELPAADGTRSQVALLLSGSPLSASARVEARPQSGESIFVDAKVSPLVAASALRSGGRFPVSVSISAARAQLFSLVPPSDTIQSFSGQVDSDLSAQLEVEVAEGKPRPAGLSFKGALEVKEGEIKIPRSNRALRSAGLKLSGDGGLLRIERLEAHESDLQHKDRAIEASGSVSFAGAAPEQAQLDIKASKWLVFGGSFGPTDAPRGSLDADLGAELKFSPESRKIKVSVRSLELLSPDRFLRAHQQEAVSIGDLVEIKSASQIGNLRAAQADDPAAPPPPAPAASAPPAPPGGEAGADARATEIEIVLPPSAHIKQAPLDMRLTGAVRVRLQGGRRSTAGRLEVTGGSIFIGGRLHEVEQGELRFDEENPGGYVDIVFKRSPHAAALRDVATGSADAVRIHLQGPLGKQKPSYEGLGVASLFDTLAINNAGRARNLSQPDMPASEAAQLPQYMQLRQMTFMAVNLPHLLFLDRISVWADPYDDRRAYGRMTRHVAESFFGSGRVRTASQPQAVGASDGEVSLDLLFQNSPRVVSGVGVKAGTRGGGGPWMFWEWSSAD